MTIGDEAVIISKYSQKFDGSFYRLLGEAALIGHDGERIAIKMAFPEWWERCLVNTLRLKKRGVVPEDW
jgi:hypothetical protein